MTAHGQFHWNELMTNDVPAAKAFFEESLGWTFDEMPMPDGTYWIAKAGDQMAGGMMDMTGFAPEGAPPHWMAYLAVDDVDARLAKAKAAGAEILREPFDVEGVGRIAILKDPTGAAIGWMTPTEDG